MNRSLIRLARVLALIALVSGLLGLPANAQGTWLRIGDPPDPPNFLVPAAVYDSLEDRVLVFSPTAYVDFAPTNVAEIWEFRLGLPDSGWRLVPTLGTPPPSLMGTAMVLDEPNRRLLCFGGYSLGVGSTNDLYALSLVGTPTWSVVPAVKDTLRTRYQSFACIDQSTRELVVYGGVAAFVDHDASVSDLWTLPLDGAPVWRHVPTANAIQVPRLFPQYAWDPSARRILLHGGFSPSGSDHFSDTWALTLGVIAVWSPLATTGPQVTRWDTDMIVDGARDRLILLPGSGSSYPPNADDRETYALPLAPGGQWARVPAAHAFAPSSYSLRAVLDKSRQRAVAIGPAYTQSLPLADTSGWSRVWPPDPIRAPGDSRGQALLADPIHQSMWRVGGSEVAGFAGLWKLDPTTAATWTRYVMDPALPGSGYATAFDDMSHRILVSDYVYDVRSGMQIHAIDLDGTPTQTVFSARDTSPSPRVDHATVIDPVRRQLVLFGGQYEAAHFNGHSLDDLWTVPLDDPSAWAPLMPVGIRPPARGGHFMFHDTARDRVVMFGGSQQTGGPVQRALHDAWALELSGTPAWSRLDSTAWDPPDFGRITFDPVRQRLFLFHAESLGPGPSRVYTRGTADTDPWTELSTTGTAPHEDAPIAFAPWCDRLVIDGSNLDGRLADETWALQVDHAVATLASVEAVDVTPSRVALAWRVAGAAASAFGLSRRTGDGAYDAPRILRPDGEGRVAFVDSDVAPGASYTYRLSEAGRTLIETGVHVPARFVLSLAGTRPSPAHGALTLAFSLPADSPVRFELFDVRGARVLARDLGLQTAGDHVWPWRESARLAPGLYLARITTRAGRREAKVVELP